MAIKEHNKEAFGAQVFPDDWQSTIGKILYISQTQPMQIIEIVEALQALWNRWDGVEHSMLVVLK